MENTNDQAKKLTKDEVKALRAQVLRTRVKAGKAGALATTTALEGGFDTEIRSETW